MKRSTKAALLSGLIFPGIGHLYLRQYLRGSVLVLAALGAFSIITHTVMQRAMTVVDQINSGQVPIDTASIAELVARSGAGADSGSGDIAIMVLGACWLIGIIDAYRLGAEKKQGSDAS